MIWNRNGEWKNNNYSYGKWIDKGKMNTREWVSERRFRVDGWGEEAYGQDRNTWLVPQISQKKNVRGGEWAFSRVLDHDIIQTIIIIFCLLLQLVSR